MLMVRAKCALFRCAFDPLFLCAPHSSKAAGPPYFHRVLEKICRLRFGESLGCLYAQCARRLVEHSRILRHDVRASCTARPVTALKI